MDVVLQFGAPCTSDMSADSGKLQPRYTSGGSGISLNTCICLLSSATKTPLHCATGPPTSMYDPCCSSHDSVASKSVLLHSVTMLFSTDAAASQTHSSALPTPSVCAVIEIQASAPSVVAPCAAARSSTQSVLHLVGDKVGETVGVENEGDIVGDIDGDDEVGLSVGVSVGDDVDGDSVGDVVGTDVDGDIVGDLVGLDVVGDSVGERVGADCDGASVGDIVGDEVVGDTVGDAVGADVVGDCVGDAVGLDVDGDRVGDCVGSDSVGDSVGETVGDVVGDRLLHITWWLWQN